MEQERRKAPRTSFSLEVEVWGRKGPNKIADLSTGGVFIYAERPSQFKVGDKIELVLKFPTQQEAMLVKAQVSRVTGEGIGVKFTGLTPDSAKVIEDCYNSFKEADSPEDS